jgi:hippurate hydrolase
MTKLFFSFNLLAAFLSTAIYGQDLAARQGIDLARSRLNEEYPSLEKLYHHLHAHPELSLHEEKTAERLASELRDLGIEVTPKVGGHGVVGVFRNGNGRTILLRADLDALPVKEQTGLAYASKVKTTDDKGNEVDVMHACGHDVHMTALVGAARMLVHLKDQWRGTLVLIGQPAEEREKGAERMLAAGLFSRFPKPDYCLALHVNAELPAGTVGLTEGFTMANVDSVDITIRGVGGHGAWPHKTKDPVLIAAQTIVALQTIVSRERDPLEPAVVTVGSIHGGTKHNVIPDEVQLQLTVRSFTDEMRRHLLDSIERIARGQAFSAGLPEDRMPIVKILDEFTPAAYNNPELTRRLAAVFKRTLGEGKVLDRKPTMGGEDFGQYGRTKDKIPICMFWLGSVEPEQAAESERTGQSLPSLHSSLYHPLPEPTIKTGVMAMTTAVLELAAKK